MGAVGDSPVDLLGQPFCGGRRGQRSKAFGDLHHLLGEQIDEVVIQSGNHDEPLGGVTGLAGVLEPSGHGGIDGGIKVIGAEDDKRVGSAEFEHHFLEVAAGDLGHRCTGALRAGQRNPLNSRVGDGFRDLIVGRVDVDIGPLG